MALDFRKVAAPKGRIQDDGGDVPSRRPPARAAAASSGQQRWHGRSSPPPPPGSGWTAFLDWACEGAFDHSPEDAALAMRFWTGRENADDEPRPPSP